MHATTIVRLLWLDSLGGLGVGGAMLLAFDVLAPWYGLAPAVLAALGLANLLYGLGSGALALAPRWRRDWTIGLLAVANVAWGGVCWWVWRQVGHEARWPGQLHLLLEGTYVPLLGLVEWRWRRALVASADARGPRWALLECRVPPPIVALISAAAMHMLARTVPVPDLTPVARPAGLGVMALGGGLALWAILAFRRAATTIHPMHPHEASSLVIAGPNRWSRNPMYVGLLLVLTGWGLWLRSAPALLVVPLAWAWLQRFQVQPEERALKAKFGAAYAAYAARVRRWG